MNIEQKHTPEPWYAIGDTIYKDIKDERHSVADCHNWAEETEANARRIVACVNACRGIGTKLLEDTQSFADVLTNEALLVEQRDELAEALRLIANYEAVNEMTVSPARPVAPQKMQAIASAALAKVQS